MTTSTWTPAETTPTTILPSVLEKMIAAGQATEPDMTVLADNDIAACRYVMQKDLAFWQANVTDLKADKIIALIRFFTIAEKTNTNWHGGEQSPVIYLNKVLKQQGCRLDKPLLQWIRLHSSNQFLPNGPITF